MIEIKLNRTDMRPLAFYGDEIAYASDKEEKSTRWTNVRVYRTDRNGYVVGIAKLTCFMGERDDLKAEPLKTKKEVIAFVQREVPHLADAIALELDERTIISK